MKKRFKLKGGLALGLIIFILVVQVFLTPQPITEATTIETIKSQEEQEIEKLYILLEQEAHNIKKDKERWDLSTSIYRYGIQYDINPLLLLSIARLESHFRKKIEGPGNCWGYFQINLNYHKVSQNFLNDTYEQTRKACEIYTYFREIHKGNVVNTLNGYNGWANQKNPYAQKVLNHYKYYVGIIGLQENQI